MSFFSALNSDKFLMKRESLIENQSSVSKTYVKFISG
jgi:hypothetical protein